MRSSLRAILPAALLTFLAFVPLAPVWGEDVQFEENSSGGSQLRPEGPDKYVPSAKNLNTVPEGGGEGPTTNAGDSPWVKQILSSRPSEDLVICIAGCYAGRDRVVYAQPTTKAGAAQSNVPQQPRQKVGAIDPSN